MKLIIDIDEDVRIAITRMGLLRIPDEMQKKVDKAIQSGTPLDKLRAEISDFEEEVFQRPNTDYSDYAAVRHCLEIIDNYRGDADEVS